MSLSLSVRIPHDRIAHFRLGELNRVVARHTAASPTHDQPKPRLTTLQIEPIAHAQIPALALHDYCENDATPRVSTFERLCRLKLGPHRQSDADPIA